jgi:hypothetical protein
MRFPHLSSAIAVEPGRMKYTKSCYVRCTSCTPSGDWALRLRTSPLAPKLAALPSEGWFALTRVQPFGFTAARARADRPGASSAPWVPVTNSPTLSPVYSGRPLIVGDGQLFSGSSRPGKQRFRVAPPKCEWRLQGKRRKHQGSNHTPTKATLAPEGDAVSCPAVHRRELLFRLAGTREVWGRFLEGGITPPIVILGPDPRIQIIVCN